MSALTSISNPLSRRSFLAAPAVLLASAAPPAKDRWDGVDRIVAVGDVHGDCDALVATLKQAKVVDDQANWIGGTTHVVQIGDIPARGSQTRTAFDLLMKLEQQAQAAGGHCHCLIGNHEVMPMYADFRSIMPAEYAQFATPDSGKLLEGEFEKTVAEHRAAGRLPTDPQEFEKFRAGWMERHPPGFVEFREAMSPRGKYGAWIGTHNAAIRINDTLFVHGGISPTYLREPFANINATIRKEIADPSKLPPGLSTLIAGPLWYRALAEDPEGPQELHVFNLLRLQRATRLVIGHSVTRTAILPRFQSRVVDIDIGLSKFYGRPPACLVLENGHGSIIHNGTTIALPAGSKKSVLDYLHAVEACDPQPEIIREQIARLS